ncbi:MAG: Fe-S cluster assembly scaffold IscU [Holosporales bacterium]|jgi:nitrogen fixation NifU-like protein|nr:Fe-S cluster assembly scaffold IscU [Holosporales bacterium]
MQYSRKVVELCHDTSNIGTLDEADQNVGTGLVGSPACGDVLRLQILVDKQGIIQDAKFKTFGCGSAIAASALATEWMKGKTLEQANSIKNDEIAEHLALPPIKLHCSVLAESAIKDAIDNYKSKQNNVPHADSERL